MKTKVTKKKSNHFLNDIGFRQIFEGLKEKDQKIKIKTILNQLIYDYPGK